jgi:hypothetical protein
MLSAFILAEGLSLATRPAFADRGNTARQIAACGDIAFRSLIDLISQLSAK